MKPRTIIAASLLAFIVISVSYLIVKESGWGKWDSLTEKLSNTAQNADTALSLKADTGVVAYYFIGNIRCETCKTIEVYTKEALESGFADDIKNSRLEFKVVNVEKSANEHFVQDYQLTFKTVVIARFENRKQKTWKSLDKVWDLVDDKDAFLKYIQNETSAILKGSS